MQAIEKLVEGVDGGVAFQTLLGVTGSGKTFTMAKVIEATNRPTLVLSHNKTLAAQLYQEFKAFFPDNAVEYFVSYYDYYQPEAYVPTSDTFIEKETSINEEIDRMRLSATRSLFERRDVLIVASVSCIYGLGSPEAYFGMLQLFEKNQEEPLDDILRQLAKMQYERTHLDLAPGSFRLRGDTLEIYPPYDETAVRISFWGDQVERIERIDPVRAAVVEELERLPIYPRTHYVTPRSQLLKAIDGIRVELDERLTELNAQDKLLEAQRLAQRANYDLEMLTELGYCSGIENYSRHLTGRLAGEPPPTLLDYFPNDFLCIIDESHVTVPQVGGMFHGDRSRKQTLVDFGFRLPSALDNRPLMFEEFEERIHQVVFVSATPGPYELEHSEGEVVEQLIRPTGLLDPQVEVRPAAHQVDDLLGEIREVVARGERVLVTTLTKRMAEDLSTYLAEVDVRVRYLHSEIKTLERSAILADLRKGEFDVLVGINLLREGSRSARGVAGGDPRCRSGRISALRDLAHPDHRPRREKSRGEGHPLCRPGDRFDAAGAVGDPAPARQTGRVQRGPRDRAEIDHQGRGEPAAGHGRTRLLRPRGAADEGGRRRRRNSGGRRLAQQAHHRARKTDADGRQDPRVRGGRAPPRPPQGTPPAADLQILTDLNYEL